jgi:hypothetical protein
MIDCKLRLIDTDFKSLRLRYIDFHQLETSSCNTRSLAAVSYFLNHPFNAQFCKLICLFISYSNAFRRTRRHPQGVYYITVRSFGTPNGYKYGNSHLGRMLLCTSGRFPDISIEPLDSGCVKAIVNKIFHYDVA